MPQRFRFKRVVRQALVDIKFDLDKKKRNAPAKEPQTNDSNAVQKRRLVALTFDVNGRL